MSTPRSLADLPLADRLLGAFRLGAIGVAVGALLGAGCASSQPKRTTGVRVVRPGEPSALPTEGLSPDKEAEARLVLQQRESSTRRCYQDVLSAKGDRTFQGTVKLLISLGTNGQATDVRPDGGTLHDQEVVSCLVETIKGFEFPALTQPGTLQYELLFRPAF